MMLDSTLQIDRMTMEIGATSAVEGRRIALQVAAGLAAPGALPAIGDIPAVRIEVAAADPGTDGSELARHIVAATLRQLRRLS
jgi:hypothetical protein